MIYTAFFFLVHLVGRGVSFCCWGGCWVGGTVRGEDGWRKPRERETEDASILSLPTNHSSRTVTHTHTLPSAPFPSPRSSWLLLLSPPARERCVYYVLFCLG